MQKLVIKKGSFNSDPLIIGHKKVAAIYAPASTAPTTISIFGGFDTNSIGPIKVFDTDRVLNFPLEKYPHALVFDASYFYGISYFVLAVDTEAEEDIIFHISLTDV